MSRKGFLILGVSTAIAVVAALGLVLAAELSDDRGLSGDELLFPALAADIDELSSVTIETARYQLRLEYRDGRWLSVDRGDYPVIPDPIVGIVTSLASMTMIERKTENPDWYDAVGVAGVGPGSESVHIAMFGPGNRVLADAIFGIPSESVRATIDGGMFVRRAGEATTWLAKGNFLVPGFAQEWFDFIMHVPGTDIARTTIFAGGEMLLDAVKVDFVLGDYDLAFLSPTVGPEGAVANDNGMRGVAQAIVTLALDDARPRDTVTIPPNGRMVRFETRRGLHLDVTLAEADGETWVVFDATAAADAEAADQARDIVALTSRWAFRLPPHRIIALSRPLAELFTVPGPAAAPGAALPPGVVLPVQPTPAPIQPPVIPLLP